MYIHMYVYDCIWLYMIVYDCIWLYMIVYDCIWLYMIVCDCMWLYVIVCDCICTYVCFTHLIGTLFGFKALHRFRTSSRCFLGMRFGSILVTLSCQAVVWSCEASKSGNGIVQKKHEYQHISSHTSWKVMTGKFKIKKNGENWVFPKMADHGWPEMSPQ